MKSKDESEIPKKVRNTIRLIPEIKTKVNQDKKISNVCPISGCIIKYIKYATWRNVYKILFRALRW